MWTLQVRDIHGKSTTELGWGVVGTDDIHIKLSHDVDQTSETRTIKGPGHDRGTNTDDKWQVLISS